MRLSSSGSFPWKPSHNQKLQRFIMGKTLSTITPPDKTKQSKQSSKQTHVFCTGRSQEGCWSVHVTLLQSTARGRKERGKHSEGCGAFANPSGRHPVLLPPICSMPGTQEQLLQLQVCSQNGPRDRWNLSSHKPQVGVHYNSHLKLGRIYSWDFYFYWITDLSPLPE